MPLFQGSFDPYTILESGNIVQKTNSVFTNFQADNYGTTSGDDEGNCEYNKTTRSCPDVVQTSLSFLVFIIQVANLHHHS